MGENVKKKFYKMDGAIVFGNLRIMDTENDVVLKFKTRIELDTWLRDNNLQTSDIDWK